MTITSQGRVNIAAVHKSFAGVEVLRGIDLQIAPGEVTVILGPSGSGKSTLLRTINHLEKLDRGSIDIDGELVGYRRHSKKDRSGNETFTLHELPEREVLRQRTQVGMVFQNFNLFPHLSVLENIVEAPIAALGQSKAVAQARALELLDRVGLKDRAQAYPRQLSGGQQQRVAIARSLALEPKVLLFDEPTSALDPELVKEVLDVIKDLARSGKTLIIVSHEIGFAREIADRIVFMDDGRIIDQGTAQHLFSTEAHPRAQAFLAKVL